MQTKKLFVVGLSTVALAFMGGAALAQGQETKKPDAQHEAMKPAAEKGEHAHDAAKVAPAAGEKAEHEEMGEHMEKMHKKEEKQTPPN
ncbi:MAG: hypothetical protein ACOY99_09240 [Pseudomonadota bacterium]